MKFSEYKYHHLDVEKTKKDIQEICHRMESAKDYDEFKKAFVDLNTLNSEISTQLNLVEIRHSINTQDEYYKKEEEYVNEIAPRLQEDLVKAGNIVLNSPFRSVLAKEVPSTYFLAKEYEKKVFSPEIVEDLQKENKLSSRYQELISTASVEFKGEKRTLSQLEPFMKSKNRHTRKMATKAYWKWFADNEEELNDIFDSLVKVRDGMAKKLGYENFIAMGYYRMYRFDYDQKDVATYRKQILEKIVPVNNELYEQQRVRLGLDHLNAWDEKIEFKSGNPKLKYDKDTMVSLAMEMYKELDEDTGKFFEYMVDHDLMDLESKPNKAGGGYCTYINDYESPFIFANFNQTSGDVEVLTHEAGHAFQVYSSKDVFPIECLWPTSESAEIHSMSMEFLTYPWMHRFFEEDTDKFFFNHVSAALKFLPYGVLVDHFQHEVYANPTMSPQERHATWRKLEKQYLPHKNYSEIEYLEKGGWWMRQLHIFMDPFYYIDYTLAQVLALQFWTRDQKKDPETFKDYKAICKVGGSLPFKEIVKLAHLRNPFEEGCLDEVTIQARTFLDSIKGLK